MARGRLRQHSHAIGVIQKLLDVVSIVGLLYLSKFFYHQPLTDT